MKQTLIEKIIEHVLGHKYYVNIISTRGTFKCETTSFIHPTKQAAIEHKREIETTLTYQWIETISFRSHNRYPEL